MAAEAEEIILGYSKCVVCSSRNPCKQFTTTISSFKEDVSSSADL